MNLQYLRKWILNDLRSSTTVQLECFEFSPPRKVPLRHKLRKRHSMNKRNAQSNKAVAHFWNGQGMRKLFGKFRKPGNLQELFNILWQNADLRCARSCSSASISTEVLNWHLCLSHVMHYIAVSTCADVTWCCNIILSTWWILIMTYSDSYYDMHTHDRRFAGLWRLTDTAWKISVWSNRDASRFCQSRRRRPLRFRVGHLLSAFNDMTLHQSDVASFSKKWLHSIPMVRDVICVLLSDALRAS